MTVNRYLKIVVNIILITIFSLFVASCSSDSKKYSYKALSKEDRGNTRYKGHYKVGEKYQITNSMVRNETFKPKEVTRYSKVGMASWYGTKHGFHGKKTANGDVYNKNMLTAAHRTLQMPSLVKVTNLENQKSVIVLVNDRGPYAHNREIDVSEQAAIILGMRQKGTAKVRVQYMHAESQKFLKTLGLEKKSGSKAKKPLNNSKCTVNCHVKLINLKYKKDVNLKG